MDVNGVYYKPTYNWRWGFPQMGVPNNGCFIFMENPVYKWITGDSPILGHHPIYKHDQWV